MFSHWLTLASTNGGQPTLALEADARMTDVLSQYLKTGNFEPLLDLWLPNNSMDFLEFSANLRRLALQVWRIQPTPHRAIMAL